MTLSRGHAWLVAGVATLAMSVSYVDRQVMANIATSVRKALDIDAEHFGWLAGAFSLAYLLVAPLAGTLVDRMGARRGLMAAMAAWSLVSAAHALVPSFAALLALRILLGVTEAPSFPAAAQSVRRALPAGDRSAAFGLLFTGSSLGAVVAAPLAIGLDARFGWRTAFLVASLLGMGWLPLWLLVTGVPAVREVLALPEADVPRPGPSPSRGPSFGALFADRAVLRALVLVVATAPALMFVFVWLPQYIELGRGIPRHAVARYVWLPLVMADLGMLGFGMLASQRDRRAVGGPRSHVELVLVAAAMESGLAGGGGLYTVLTADMMARIDPARVSTAGGLTAAAQSLVYVVLNPVVGRWVDRTHSFDGSLVLLGLLSLPGALVWALTPMRAASFTAATPAR